MRALAQIHIPVAQSEWRLGLVLQAHVVVQVARAVIGHNDQLHGLALATIRKGDVVGHDRQRRGHGHVGVLGRAALVQRRACLRKVIGVGDRQQVIARNVPVLFGRKRHRCVANAHTADHERRTPRDTEDGHKGALFVTEQIARGHLVQKAHAAPNKANALEENARAGARGLGAHERGRSLGHLVAAGDNRGAHHAHGKQRHRYEREHDVVRKQHLGQRVHVVEHRKQEQRQAHKANDIAEHATDQTRPQRVVHVFGQDASARIAECFVQANERALLLDHAGGGGEADEHGDDKEDKREYGGDGLDRRTIALDARVACDIAAILDVPGAFAQVRELAAGIGKLLVGGGTALVQVDLRLRTLLAALGHAVDVVLLDPKDHIRLTLSRVQARRCVDRQLLSARLLTLLTDLLDIALDLVNPCRIGIGIGVEALGSLDDHVNRRIGRRRRGILAYVELVVRCRRSTEGIDRRVGAHVGGIEDLSRNGVIARGKLILGALIRRVRIVGGKTHRIAELFARCLQKARSHRHLTRSLGQVAAHQHRLVNILFREALHDHALARRAHGGVGGLGIDALGRLDAIDLLDRSKVIIGQAVGRLHVDVIDILLVKVSVDRIAQVLATRLEAAHHAHAERRDDHDGQEAFKAAANRAVDATAKHRRHHVV